MANLCCRCGLSDKGTMLNFHHLRHTYHRLAGGANGLSLCWQTGGFDWDWGGHSCSEGGAA